MIDATADTSGPPEPRANEELIGHQSAERLFLDSWHKGRLAHAWLILGPDGVGKATLAYRLARTLLADGVAEDRHQSVFRQVAVRSHADLFSLERPLDLQTNVGRGEITIDEARKVGPFLHLTAAQGGWRVVVVDGADTMNRNAANAVLKIIEEPPAKAVILMTSSGGHKVLPTIRSRCRVLTLRPLEASLVAPWLCRHRLALDSLQAEALARISGGCPGNALRLADEAGLRMYDEMLSLMDSLPRLDVEAVHEFADRLSRPRVDNGFGLFLELFGGLLVRLVRAVAVGKPATSGLLAEDNLINRLAQGGAGLDRWMTLWEKTIRLTAQTETLTLDRKQVLLTIFDDLEDVCPVDRQTYRP